MSDHPIRLVVTDDLERHRLTVFFRLVLAIPHYIWLGVWTFVALLAGVVNWMATILLGRSPGALHRFLAAYVKYTTQVYAYVHLAAEPYPSFDGPDGYPVDLRIAPPERQSRWKTALRLPLALPAIAIGGVLVGVPGTGKARAEHGSQVSSQISFDNVGLLLLVAVLGWFAVMARGRMPRGLRDGAAYALSYGAQLWGYLLLLTDRYPNSDPLAALSQLPVRSDPIGLEGEDEERRSRLTTFFRLPLCFPHILWLYLWGILALLAVICSWLATLVRGRSPAVLHGFLAAYLRYSVSVYAFLFLIANPFPGFVGAVGTYPLEVRVAEPDRQSRWGVLFRLVLAIPALAIVSVYGSLLLIVGLLGWFASLTTGRMPRGMRNAGALALRYQAQTTGYLMLLTASYPYSGPCVGEADQDVPAPPVVVAPPVL